jgi:hypothetical protein
MTRLGITLPLLNNTIATISDRAVGAEDAGFDTAFDALMMRGPQALQDVTDDRLVEQLSITGTPDEARTQFARYAESIPHVLLHTPYAPPLSGEESEDGVRRILETFSRN